MNTLADSQNWQDDNDQQKLLINEPRVFVDFGNADAEGCLRLNCIGTIEDLALQKIELRDGQLLTLYSEDIEVDGTVRYSPTENLWVAVIDWNEIRQTEEIKTSHRKLLDFAEKATNAIEILVEKYKETSQADNEDLIRYELEDLVEGMKQDLKYAHAAFVGEQDNGDAGFYQQFAGIFGKKEADEIWAARSWNTKLVLRDLTRILMEEPELRQRIEERGVNFEEIIDKISAEEQFIDSNTSPHPTDEKSRARLREVICCL
jgi:hypothetical protein